MRDLTDLSGPWRGMSTQELHRITENLRFSVADGRLKAEGSDRDGNFCIVGEHKPDGSVRMVRVYHYCTRGAGHTGVPYEYVGRWDGSMIAGFWHVAANPAVGGPFEMWPESDEDLRALREVFECLLVPA